MLRYIGSRIALMIPLLIVISIVSFIIIQLPPGDYLSTLVAELEETGDRLSQAELARLRQRYGLDQPIYVQYWRWITGVVRGDFGWAFGWNAPVRDVIGQRLPMTIILTGFTLMLTWIVALPIGIYCAVNQYTKADYFFTFLSFIGLATPNFLLALVLMFVSVTVFGGSVGGLFSPEYVNAPWSWARALDLLSHLWIPAIVIGTAGTASLTRIMRGNLLDELRKPYVVAARARGVPFRKVLFRYPVRVAMNPFISTIGRVLPDLVSGTTITAIVLNLPTTGPVLHRALMSQDMFVAGGFLLMVAVLTLIGTLISDILLALVDPRVRFGVHTE
ncbi:MAG: ABC transporter permease [Firmicutes bacterium]|nr:ABC transporter permease [Bacillota bacterium]